MQKKSDDQCGEEKVVVRSTSWGTNHLGSLERKWCFFLKAPPVWVQLLGGQRACVRVFLVLRKCIWNAPAVSFVLPAFDDTCSLDSPSRQVVYPPV